jgi:hypothetical protein
VYYKNLFAVFILHVSRAPSDEGKYDFEINYLYKNVEEEVAKFKPQVLKDISAQIISLPLPLLIGEQKP